MNSSIEQMSLLNPRKAESKVVFCKKTQKFPKIPLNLQSLKIAMVSMVRQGKVDLQKLRVQKNRALRLTRPRILWFIFRNLTEK